MTHEVSGPFSILYEADGSIYKLGPFKTENEAVEAAQVAARGEDCEFDKDDQNVYLIRPDHSLQHLSSDDLKPDNVVILPTGTYTFYTPTGTISFVDNNGKEVVYHSDQPDYAAVKATYFKYNEVEDDDEDDDDELEDGDPDGVE